MSHCERYQDDLLKRLWFPQPRLPLGLPLTFHHPPLSTGPGEMFFKTLESLPPLKPFPRKDEPSSVPEPGCAENGGTKPSVSTVQTSGGFYLLSLSLYQTDRHAAWNDGHSWVREAPENLATSSLRGQLRGANNTLRNFRQWQPEPSHPGCWMDIFQDRQREASMKVEAVGRIMSW